jgi:hypothetical protein
MAIDGLPATEQQQAQFLDCVREGFAAASARTGEIVRDFHLADTWIRLRFAGEALISAIVPGLAGPVPSFATEPQFEICLWDTETTGVPLARRPRPVRDFTGRGNIWGFDSCRYRSAYQWGEGSVSVMDRETRQAVFWVPSSQQLPTWVLASPLRSILHWCMELNGRQLVHAAAVGFGGRGVLLPGRGGSGKSSTALACLVGGLDFISDDYLALALDPEPRAYRLYSTAKLNPRSLTLYPELASRCRTVYQPGFDKLVLFLEDGYRDQLRESLPVDLVLTPYITGLPETTLAPVERQEVERALAAETLGHLPHVGSQTVEFLDRASREIPRAAIHLGIDRTAIPSAIKRALETRTTIDVSRYQAGTLRPFVSVIAHFRQEDREELRTLAEEVEAQGYPRTEFIAAVDGTDWALADYVAQLPGTVRLLPSKDPVVNAEAWNRGIRESFSEFLILIEPGDRLQPGALDALVDGVEQPSGAAWVRGRLLSAGPREESFSPLRGALIRKSAFRRYGLFHTDPFFQGREHQEWLKRLEREQAAGRQLEAVILRAACSTSIEPRRPSNDGLLTFLKGELDRQRRGAGNNSAPGTKLNQTT